MSDQDTDGLHTEVKALCQMMIRAHYFDEANWLWMATVSPQLCATTAAQEALESAKLVAGQFGFRAVALHLGELLREQRGIPSRQ